MARKRSRSKKKRRDLLRRTRAKRRFELERLEERQLLAVTPHFTSGGVELELSYEASQTIDDLDDIYLQTDASGNLEWSTSQNGTFTDLENLADGSVSSYEVKVTYKSSATEDAAAFDLSLEDDLKSTLFLKDIAAPGVSLTLGAMDIEVMSGSTISTRDLASGVSDPLSGASDGNSGDLTINGVMIDVRSDAQLFTHVTDDDTTNAAGSITINADGALDDFQSSFGTIPFAPDVAVTKARALFESATVKGGTITVDVTSDSADLFDDSDPLGGWGETLAEYVGGLSVGAGVAVSTADATLTLDGATFEGNDISLSSDAATEADATVLTVYAAIAYGHSEPTASVNIKNGSSIDAAGNLDLFSHAASDMAIAATQNLLGTSNTVEKYNVTLAGAYSNITSDVKLSSDSQVDVGANFTVDADAVKDHSVGSFAAAYGDGTLGVALNVAVHESSINALMDGTITVGGDMIVQAELDTLKNDYTASSSVGTGPLGQKVIQSKVGAILRGFTAATMAIDPFKSIRSSVGREARQNTGSNRFDLSAAINVGLAFNDMQVRIGPDANVDVGGDLRLEGTVEEFPETSAFSFLNSSAAAYPKDADGFGGKQSQRESGAAGALTGGWFQNEIDVYIGSNATVTVGGDLTLKSNAQFPHYIQYFYDESTGEREASLLSAIQDKANYNLGIQNGFFTSWAEAVASAQEKSYGGMLNLLFTDTHNYAYIAEGAQVTVGEDLSVIAETLNDTINFAGSPLGIWNATAGTGIGVAVMAVGYLNDTKAKIHSKVVVNADSLLVFADSRGQTISIALQGGISDDEGGFNGAFTSRFIDSKTTSQISSAADINLDDGNVKVPVTFKKESRNNTTFATSIPQFDPNEAFDTDSNDNDLIRVDEDADTITLPYAHGLTAGDPVVYHAGVNTLADGTMEAASPINGLVDGTTYYVIASDDIRAVQLSATPFVDGDTPDPIDISLTDTTGFAHSLYPGFRPEDDGVVDTTANEITLPFEHNLRTGQPVKYSNGGGTSVGGLTDGTTYYAFVTGPTTYKLATSSGKAVDASLTEDATAQASLLIDLTGGATGTGHSLLPQEYTNLKVAVTLESLDSNDDGKVTTADEHVTGYELIPGLPDDPSANSIVTDLNMLVMAEDNADLYSGTGAATKTSSSASGFTASVDVIKRNTQAFIGAEEFALDDVAVTPGLGVDSSDLIVLDYDHGFTSGDQVVYTSGGDYPIGGLRDRGIYTVTEASDNTFRIGRSSSEGSATFSATDVDDTDGVWTIDLGYTHGFQIGDSVKYTKAATDTAIGGLTQGETYFVVHVDDTTIALASTLEGAIEQDEISFFPHAAIVESAISLDYDHEIEEGEFVLYNSNGGADVGGLTSGTVYEIVLDSERPQILYLQEVGGSSIIELDSTEATGVGHTLQRGFSPAADVVTSGGESALYNDTIEFSFAHGLVTGDRVRYDKVSDTTPVGSLVDGQVYYVVVIDGQTIALVDSEDAAEAGRQRYFHPGLLIDNGDATAADKFDTIDLYTDHGYEDGDQVLYLQYDGPDIGLTDGAIYTVQLPASDPAPDPDSPVSRIQLLDSSGVLVELTQGANSGFFAFSNFGSIVNLGVRESLANTSGSGVRHFFHRDARLELDASTATGSSHALRLTMDTSTTYKKTHGFGRPFAATDSSLNNTDSDDADDTIDLGFDHNFVDGQAVIYSAGQGEPIGGLNEGVVYYVVTVEDSTTDIQLAETYEKATRETDEREVVEYSLNGATGDSHSFSAVLRPIPAVDGASDEINFGRLHGLVDGEQLTYRAGGGTKIDGLTHGDTYTVIVTGPTTIQLSESTSPTAIDLTSSTATGTNHQFLEQSEPGAQTVGADGDLGILATNTGTSIAVTVAGVLAKDSKTNSYTGAGWSSFKPGKSEAERYSGGMNFSGTVAVAIVADTTRAYIEDATIDTLGGISLYAQNSTTVYSGAGAITVATADSVQSGRPGSGAGSKAMAGALSVNVVANRTEATITDSTILASSDVEVFADADGSIASAGIGAAFAAGELAAAGVITVNAVAMDTVARIKDSTVDAVNEIQGTAGDVIVDSTNQAFIGAFSGAISASWAKKSSTTQNTSSVGFGISLNVVTNDSGDGTLAEIVDSEIEAQDVEVNATSVGHIITIGLAGAFARSRASSALAANAAFNVVSTKTTARIRKSDDETEIGATGDVTVAADDTTNIFATGGAIFLSLGQVGGKGAGLALSVNTVTTDVEASISDATVDASSVALSAKTNTDILAVNASLGYAKSIAFAGQLGLNYTDQNANAFIRNSTVTTDGTNGDVKLLADNNSSIVGLGRLSGLRQCFKWEDCCGRLVGCGHHQRFIHSKDR